MLLILTQSKSNIQFIMYQNFNTKISVIMWNKRGMSGHAQQWYMGGILVFVIKDRCRGFIIHDSIYIWCKKSLFVNINHFQIVQIVQISLYEGKKEANTKHKSPDDLLCINIVILPHTVLIFLGIMLWIIQRSYPVWKSF